MLLALGRLPCGKSLAIIQLVSEHVFIVMDQVSALAVNNYLLKSFLDDSIAPGFAQIFVHLQSFG